MYGENVRPRSVLTAQDNNTKKKNLFPKVKGNLLPQFRFWKREGSLEFLLGDVEEVVLDVDVGDALVLHEPGALLPLKVCDDDENVFVGVEVVVGGILLLHHQSLGVLGVRRVLNRNLKYSFYVKIPVFFRE